MIDFIPDQMSPLEYQQRAARTIACKTPLEMGRHGALGLMAELTELNEAAGTDKTGIITANPDHLCKELGDCWWMLAEIATSAQIGLDEVVLDESYCNPCFQAGRIAGIFQKTYQGHEADSQVLKVELTEMAARLLHLTHMLPGIGVQTVWERNIAKLEARYPNGFEASRSLERKAGDI